MAINKIITLAVLLCFLAENISCQEEQPFSLPLPLYICGLGNINDYTLLANSGWDCNWYVGYNFCWIKKLPPAPPGDYKKAFLGAKLGRAKSRRIPGKPSWEKETIPGDIYIGISSIPAWKAHQRFFLVSAEDIPLEGDWENALEGVGEAVWFWCEVPISEISFDTYNYLCLWSTTEYFTSHDTAPILASGWGKRDSEPGSWLNDEILGAPPIDPSTSLKIPISVFEPALCIKLIPENSDQLISISISSITTSINQDKIVFCTVVGNMIERVWIETFTDKTWKKYSRYLYSTPYIFTLKSQTLPLGKILSRIGANDIWGNYGYSNTIELVVSPTEPQ